MFVFFLEKDLETAGIWALSSFKHCTIIFIICLLNQPFFYQDKNFAFAMAPTLVLTENAES